MKRAWILAGVLAITACGDDAPAAKAHIRGTFTLNQQTGMVGGAKCHGTNGYDDFAPGMDVTVKDGKGEIVGAGAARNISFTDDSDDEFLLASNKATGWASDDAATAEEIRDGVKHTWGFLCTMVFDVEVKDAEFYSVEIGSRGDQTYSRDDLKATDGYLALSLGDSS